MLGCHGCAKLLIGLLSLFVFASDLKKIMGIYI